MVTEMWEGDWLEYRLGYAHAILELCGWDYPDDEAWEHVTRDSFTAVSVRRMRRDCIMFLSRTLEVTGFSVGDLQDRIDPYDLGWDFYVARMSGSEFCEYPDLADRGPMMDAIAGEEFGPVYVDLSGRGRIHYGPELPAIVSRDNAMARRLWLEVKSDVARGNIGDDPDFRRSTQRAHYTNN